MRGWLVVVTGALLLALAPAAHAEVTIGSSLTKAPDPAFDPDGTISSTSIPGRQVSAPSSGVITRWSIRANTSVPSVQLVILRRPQGPGNTPGEVVAHSEPFVPEPDAVSTTRARLRIATGDYIGIECCDGVVTGAYVSQDLPPGSGTTVDVWSPRLEPLVPLPPTLSTSPDREVLVSAAIEPDVDGDGFGDESQDDCPTAAGVAPSGCPAPPATPRVNTPPVVRFRTPASGTAVRVAQTIELDVADDAGNPTVSVFDDDGTICALSGPPYSCTWRPTGADVGRATLLASAVDSDKRSTLGIVRVTVARFEADLTRRVRGRQVTGRLVLPAAVERALGCKGEVTVRRGKVRRTIALKRNCSYAARLPKGRGKVRARFAGNPVVEPAT